VLQFVGFCMCVDKKTQQRVLQCAHTLLCVHIQTSSIERGKNKVCCSVLQLLQCVAVCCSCWIVYFCGQEKATKCVAVCCSIMHLNAV